jgi:VanZ family protein
MKLSKRVLYILPAIILASVIFIISEQHHINLPNLGFEFQDKFFHGIAYFFFGITIVLAVNKNIVKSSLLKQIALVLLIGLIYGASDEFHQSYVQGRTADFGDWIADAIGIILSIPVYYMIMKSYFIKSS